MSGRSLPDRLVGAVRGRPPFVVDAGLAAVVYALSVFPKAWYTPVDWRLVGFDALTALPLAWRRRYPIPVTGLVACGTIPLAVLNELPKLPYGQLVATYTFVALCGPTGRLVGLVGTVLGVSCSVLFDHNPVQAAWVSVATFSAAYALGQGARARRDRIAMLEERGARLAERQARAAADERERIARDMHDILVHSVSLMVVQAEAGAAVVADDPGRAAAAFEAISQAGREALAQLRHTLGVLRGGEGARQPQPDLDALPGLVAGARGAALEARLHETGQRRPVPAELGVAAYRIVQEALTNTIKHAGARRVDVWLDWTADALRLEVTDDGRSAAPPGHGGQGLVGMRERAAACGGELRAGPGPAGTGFRVTATLLVPAPVPG